MNVPEQALPLVLMQRTRLQRDLGQMYADLVRADYAEIEPWLPARCEALLDIGCGVGGLDVCLWERYGPGVMLYLMDTIRADKRVEYGLRDAPSACNRLGATWALLGASGVPPDRCRWIALTDASPAGGRQLLRVHQQPVDLVVSLLAWGYHWPVSAYWAPVWDLVRPGGRVILDVRGGQALPMNVVKAGRRVEVVGRLEKGKFVRLCLEAVT